ncbi:hypothetical protein KKC59_01130, partial [bacterium]|nr:hypothetical protein [bacterium]
RSIITRKGDKMAFVKIEDMEGSCEITVFPETYDKYKEFLVEEKSVFIEGKVSLNQRTDTIQILADKIVSLDSVEAMYTDKVKINLLQTTMLSDQLSKLTNILKKYPGDCKVMFDLKVISNKIIKIESSNEFNVNPTYELKQEVEDLLGKDSLVLQK